MHRKREQSRRLWSRGRRMQMGEAYYLGIEAGGTHLRIAAVDRTLKVCSFKKIRSEELSDAGDKAAYLESLMVPYFREMGRENCRCVCLSLASLMDRDRTVCFNSPNIRGFDNLPLKSMLEERIHIPVEMERDANTELLYEIRRLNLPREGIVAGIYIGTGLGNAVCIDGRAYRGATGSACELGHIPVAGLTEDCGCGKKGCIELKASGRTGIHHHGCHCNCDRGNDPGSCLRSARGRCCRDARIPAEDIDRAGKRKSPGARSESFV